jgi:hypothetical protein
MVVWRLGNLPSPANFVPIEYCTWDNRFDDPYKTFRTLYCAEKIITCLREVLAPLKPNQNTIEDFNAVMGHDPLVLKTPILTMKYRRRKALVKAELVIISGSLRILEKNKTMQFIHEQIPETLSRYEIKSLTLETLRSDYRELTQKLTRLFFDHADAGVEYHSKLDGHKCFALFEDRAYLKELRRERLHLSKEFPELTEVCREFNLEIEKPFPQ